ncbi:class I SAM-dependent methyltransferase [Micromonospora sp. Llam7]|uniref:class I SAM-dependent methyltransferase n=1 Tax=Micromonospora tarapacensis TaxID=2835305 RepID=UPI001C82A0BE|nr:class I SAM-dependent methyltransferase [Micromonospora tarapacensis]MBX7267152.1 class I SAM-dependent methyltransferase [Micromonospora tarapacensis]
MRRARQGPTATEGADYTQRLRRLSGARWKRLLDVQAPYRWNLRRLRLGRTLDVGSGLGRNLINLGTGAVGVDHNPTSVAHARNLGLTAYTTEEFLRSEYARPDAFDSVLAAHLLEHLPAEQAREVVASYLPFVRSGGRVVFITPQERGYHSDASHVRFVGFTEAAETCRELGLTVLRQYSFPFHRAAGKLFTYNEFVTVARRP